jgi:hypothetical protein
MVILGKEYYFIVASDLERDGLGWECYYRAEGQETLVLEVFRNDAKKCIEVNQFVNDLPLELYEYVVTSSRSKLGKLQP